jgi:type I restriction enzyme R subunit
MNEAETRAEHIAPALKAAGLGGGRWQQDPTRSDRTRSAAGQGAAHPGRLADYVLIYRNTKLAVIEAKAWDKARTARINQRFLRRQASMHAVMRSAFPCVASMLWLFCG